MKRNDADLRTDTLKLTAGMAIRPCLLLLATSLVLPLSAQLSLHPPSTNFQQLDTRDGLTDNLVSAITSDALGFWWFGTNDGLQRFDGRSFLTFRHSVHDSTSLPDNYVMALAPTADNGLWVATKDALCRYEARHQRFAKVRIDGKTVPAEYPSSFLTDAQGNLWFATTTKNGLYRLENGRSEWEQIDTSMQMVVGKSLAEDPTTGNVWFNTLTGVAFWEAGTGRVRQQRTDPDHHPHFSLPGIIHDFLLDAHGSMWATYQSPDQKRRSLLLRTALAEDRADLIPSAEDLEGPFLGTRDGNLWFYTAGSSAFLRLDPGRQRWDKYPLSPDSTLQRVRNLSVRCLYEDPEGNLWAGTNYGILIFHAYQQASMVPLAARDMELPVLPLSLFESAGNEIWMGTYFNGIHVYDQDFRLRRKVFVPDDHSDSDIRTDRNFNAVWDFCEDRQGNLWAGGQHATLRCFRPDGALLRQDRPTALRSQTVRSMVAAPDGHLWLGTHNGLVTRMDPATGDMEVVLDLMGSSPINVVVYKVIPDASKAWVVATDRLVAVRKIPGRDGPASWTDSTFLPPKGVTFNGGMALNPDTLVLFGEGIHYFDKRSRTFHRVQELDGLPNQAVRKAIRIQPDTYFLLLGKGMAVWHPARRLCLPLTNRSYELPQPEQSLNNVRLLRDGRLVVGGERQTLFVGNPDQLLTPPARLNLVLTGLQVLDRELPLPDGRQEVVLSDDHHLLTVRFACLTWLHQDNIVYRYRLVGYDADWQDNGTTQTLTLAGLAPGRYRLELQASDRSGRTRSDILSLPLYLPPPWHLTLPAKILWAGLFFLGVIALYRFQWRRKQERAEARRIQELHDFKTRFYTNITHEFRTPLTLISGMAEKIRTDPGRWQTEGLDTIRRNSSRLLQLVNQLLALARLENGSLRQQPVQADIVPLLKILFDSFAPAGRAKGLSMHFEADPDSLVMDHDSEFLRQILSNLLSNSLKFTPAGGAITLLVDRRTEKGRLRSNTTPATTLPDGPYLSIRVTDTGCGMAADLLPFIFDRFFMGKTVAGIAEGAGIGLSLSRELAKAMGGDIRVRSEPGNGAAFELLLPVRREAKPGTEQDTPLVPPPPLPTSPENGQAFDNTAGRRRPDKPVLLLVEDHPDMARYIAACLADAEFDLLTAADGAQGLDMALEQVPDLVILDVMLPSLDGFEVCRSLKSDERTSHVPVILLTAMADRDSRLSGTRLGGDLYLEKPFDPEELRLQIGRLLTQQQRMRRHYLAQAGLAPPAPPEETSAAAASPNPFVEKVLELIRANLSDSRYSVEQLSRDALVSPAQLNRKLNALTGLSAGQLIRKLRLKKAEQQLADPNQPVAAVALACGFEDASYFGRIFKKEKGVSPAEWRKKNR